MPRFVSDYQAVLPSLFVIITTAGKEGLQRPRLKPIGGCRNAWILTQIETNRGVSGWAKLTVGPPDQLSDLPAIHSEHHISRLSSPKQPSFGWSRLTMHIAQQESHHVSVLAAQGETAALRAAVIALAERERTTPGDVLTACRDDFQQTAAHMAAKAGQTRTLSLLSSQILLVVQYSTCLNHGG